MGDRVEVGVADEAPPGIVLERRVAGGMESDGYVELLQRTPQRLARLVVQVLAVDRVRGTDDSHGAQLPDAPVRLVDRRRDVVHRDLGGELQPLRPALAIVVRPVVVGARERRRVVRREVVVHEDLPPARAVHDGDVDALDIHRRQGRVGIEAAPARDLEVWVPRAAPAPQLAAGRGGGRRLAMGGNRQPLHLHTHDAVGVALVLGAVAELLLLPAEEPRRARSMGPFEVAGPEIVRLHHVKVAVEDQIAVACHVAPPKLFRDSARSPRLPRFAGSRLPKLADYLQEGRRHKGLSRESPPPPLGRDPRVRAIGVLRHALRGGRVHRGRVLIGDDPGYVSGVRTNRPSPASSNARRKRRSMALSPCPN